MLFSLIVLSVAFLISAFILSIPFWFICKKAGYSPLLSLLNLVPFCLGTLVLVYFLAFADWRQSQTSQPAPPKEA